VVTPSELTLRGLLRIVGAGLLFAAVVYLVGGFIGGFFRELPFVANSVVKVTVLGLACLYAAGNVRGRRGVVKIVLAAHLVSVGAMVAMLIFADTDRTVDLWLGDANITDVLWGAIVLDGVITLVIGVVFALTLIGPPLAQPQPGPEEPSPLTGAERRLRVLLFVLAGLLVLAGLAYGAGPLIDSTDQFAIELPFVTNSVVMCAALAMLALYAALPLRRNMPLVTPIVAGLFLSAAVQLVYLIPAAGSRPIFDGDVDMELVLLGGAVVALILGGALLVAYWQAWRGRYTLTFLWPGSYRALQAMADVLIAGEPKTIPPLEVADNVECYLRGMAAHRRWIYRLALYGMQLAAMACRGVPLSELEPGDRRAFLEQHFRKLPRWPPFVKDLLRAGIRVGQQLSFAGYYNDPKTDDSVGYRRFKVRNLREAELRKPLGLEVELPDAEVLETDVCIVGSGAGGAILAYELAMHGRDVLVLERGKHVEPRTFTDNEVEMIGRLYADGVMQQTEDFNFTVLQGSCVGGSTTVNNAVCFRPPEPVLRRWNDPKTTDAGLDLGELRKSVEHLEGFLPVTPQPEKILNPSWRRYAEGAENAGLSPEKLKLGPVHANIDDCLGCGYCNIGCAYGRKLSMLDRVLPEGQRDAKGSLRIVAECEVERIRTVSGSPQRVAGLIARRHGGRRRVRVSAEHYVLSAGAVGSSYLLLRSNAASELPVGRRLCFNMGAPLTAEFKDVQDAYAGLQISHYGIPSDNGFVFETWFNPPVAQALNMPGWFEQHFENMQSYPRLGAVGVLVGTEANARVKRALTGGPGIDYTPTKRDLTTLARGLRMLGEILFAGGARRVMVNSWGYEELTNRGQLEWIDQIALVPGYLALGTGHPQGGNAMSRDPRKGVVGPDFHVHGYDNLYIADASVIPSSLTVNPQLTVMSLAHLAAQQMKAAWR
jgi:choline dehydrogenase-like flavoprotein